MISHKPRCIYVSNQLAEVICQLRFPDILSIQTNLPADFQEAVRSIFPCYSLSKEKLPGVDTPNHNYQFSSQDGIWRVNLTSKFISLACTRYSCWEDFAKKLDAPLAAFIRIYRPACFERIGLRYLNFISREMLGLTAHSFKDLIEPCYLGILAEEDVLDTAPARCSVDADTPLRGGCRVKIHAGPGKVSLRGKTDPEVKFIFDQDLYIPGNIPVSASAGALETLHSQAYGIFRGAITQTLHRALGPN